MDDLAAFRLGQWEIDPTNGILAGDGTTERLTPKVVDVLLVLKAHRGQVVGRDELLREVRGERAVTDEPLTRAIAELRRALARAAVICGLPHLPRSLQRPWSGSGSRGNPPRAMRHAVSQYYRWLT